MSKIHLVVIFETKPTATEKFSKLIKEAVKNLPQVNGCIQASAKISETNPNQIMIFEVWKSKEDHAAHLGKLLKSGVWDQFAQHLAADPISNYYFDLE